MKLKFCFLFFITFAAINDVAAQFVTDFSISANKGCAPFVVKLKDNSTLGASSWLWTSNANLTSDKQNPTFVFTNPGIYSITLTSSNGVLSGTLTKTSIIVVYPPLVADFSVDKSSGCLPLSVQFKDLSVPQSSYVKSWFWSFGNGETSTDQNPKITYSDVKKYSVFLKATDANGCVASTVKTEFINASKPSANFIFDSLTCTIPAKVNFISSSSGGSYSYNWDFGNGITSNSEFPGSITYSNYDTIPIKLKITEIGTTCSDSITKNLYLKKFIADFDFSVLCNDTFNLVSVKDKTSPKPTSVKWNFGDGIESLNANETHAYFSNSAYNITLTATESGSCSSKKTITFKPPSPNFTFVNPVECTPPFKVDFTNTTLGNNLIYNWDFGDSIFSTLTNPSHDFSIPPTQYLVSLSATDSLLCTKKIISYVVAPFPFVDFISANSKTKGCVPITASFANKSSNILSPIKSLKWDFGDPSSGINNFGTDSLVSHTYTNPGKYTVTLILQLVNGCTDTIVKTDFIQAGILPTSADFTIFNNDTICYNESLTFTSSSTYANPIYSSTYYCWAFEETSTPMLIGNEITPIKCPSIPSAFHNYDLYINDEAPDHLYNHYKFPNPINLNNFSYQGKVDPSSNTLYTHLFIGFNGCYSEVIKPVEVLPTIAIPGFAFKDNNFDLIECDSSRTIGIYNASENYDSLVYFRVINPLGQKVLTINDLDTVFYTFDQPGKYSIEISVHNKTTTCTDTMVRKFEVIKPTIKVDFIKSVCLNDSPFVAIDSSKFSSGIHSTRVWAINGIEVSSRSEPFMFNDTLNKALTDTGWQQLDLLNTVKINDDLFSILSEQKKCVYRYTDSVYSEGSVLKIAFDKYFVCPGDSFLVMNQSASTSPIIDYAWYSVPDRILLGSNKDIKMANISIGAYQYKLIVRNSFGCVDSLISPILNVTNPTLSFLPNDSVICKNDLVTFKNSSWGENLTFEWTIENSKYLNIDAVHRFNNIGNFDVKLYAIDTYGCKDSINILKSVRVADYPTALFYADSIYSDCPPFTLNFSDTTIENIDKRKWEFGDGNIANSKNYTHTYLTPGKFDVTLTVSNSEGCSDTLIKPKYITVKGPTGTIDPYKIFACAPENILFKTTLNSVEYYIWDFDDKVIESYPFKSTVDSSNHNYKIGGVFSPVLTLIDSNGCYIRQKTLSEIKVDSILANFDNSKQAICNLKNHQFQNLSNTIFKPTYTWNFGDNSTSLDTNPIHTFAVPKIYAIKLIVNSEIGCKDSITLNIPAYEGPDEELTIKNKNFCIPATTDYILEFKNPNFVVDNTSFSLNNTALSGASITLPFTTSGIYNMQYLIEYGSGKCKVDSAFTQTYYEQAIAGFDYDPKNNSTSNSIITFSNSSQNSTIYAWDFNDGSTITSKNPIHSFEKPAKYYVQLIASNLGGCFDTLRVPISIAPYDLIKLPNAFSPDGDGVNDEFGILYSGEITLYLFTIYNRWGNLVFETNKLSDKWDGKREGVDQTVGTYVYYIQTKNKAGETIEYKGNFSLIR